MRSPLTKTPLTKFAVVVLASPLGIAAGFAVHAAFAASDTVKPQVFGAQTVKTDSSAAAAGQDKANGTFSIAGGASGLYPGGRLPLALTLENPQSFGIHVDSVTVAVTGPTPVAGATPQCTAAAVQIGLPGAAPVPAGQRIPLSVDVPKKATASAQLEVRMVPDSPDACQGASFGLSYSGTAVKS